MAEKTDNFSAEESLRRMGSVKIDDDQQSSSVAQNGTKTTEPSGNTEGTVAPETVTAPVTAAPPQPSSSGSETVTAPDGSKVTIPVQTAESAVNDKLKATAEKDTKEGQEKLWEPTAENIKRSGLSAMEYIRQAKKAGVNVDPMEVLLNYYGKDPTKSLKANEDEEKKAKTKATMDAIGNALMHVGNFAGALTKGASVPLESPVEYSKRQQALKDKTDALRQKSWTDVYNAYKQKKAEEAAAAKQEHADKQLNEQQRYHDKLAAIAAGKAQTDKDANDAKADLNAKKFEHTVDKDNKQLAINQQNANSRTVSANKKGGSGGRSSAPKQDKTTTYTHDQLGNVTSKTEHYGSTNSGNKSGGKQSREKSPWVAAAKQTNK